MANLRMIPDGEKFSSADAPTDNPNIWVSKYSFRRTQGGPRHEKTTTWDFSKCSREDLIRLTMYDLRVWAQGRLRDSGQAAVENSGLFATVDVKTDRIEAGRQPVDPTQRAIRALVALGMSEADAAKVAEQAKGQPEAANAAEEAHHEIEDEVLEGN